MKKKVGIVPVFGDYSDMFCCFSLWKKRNNLLMKLSMQSSTENLVPENAVQKDTEIKGFCNSDSNSFKRGMYLL